MLLLMMLLLTVCAAAAAQNLEFCFRTTGWDDIHLDIHEERPCLG